VLVTNSPPHLQGRFRATSAGDGDSF